MNYILYYKNCAKLK